MPVGYSIQTLKTNEAADAGHLGVQLGRLCIAKDISVNEVAERMQVSRQTVYNWFFGIKRPHEDKADLVSAFIAELTS